MDNTELAVELARLLTPKNEWKHEWDTDGDGKCTCLKCKIDFDQCLEDAAFDCPRPDPINLDDGWAALLALRETWIYNELVYKAIDRLGFVNKRYPSHGSALFFERWLRKEATPLDLWKIVYECLKERD